MSSLVKKHSCFGYCFQMLRQAGMPGAKPDYSISLFFKEETASWPMTQTNRSNFFKQLNYFHYRTQSQQILISILLPFISIGPVWRIPMEWMETIQHPVALNTTKYGWCIIKYKKATSLLAPNSILDKLNLYCIVKTIILLDLKSKLLENLEHLVMSSGSSNGE